jgi:hypothetical protein
MLDRLMRRPVLAEADGVVGEHIDHPLAHEGGETDRATSVVREDQEGAAVRDETAMEREAVHGSGHAVLADSVMDVAAVVPVAPDRAQSRRDGEVRMGEVR